jgi:predicted transposase
VIKTLQIKLLPDDDQKRAIIDTFIKFNEACRFVSGIAFEKKLYNKVFLQRIVYRDIREKFNLAAQLAVRVIAKVAETYKADKEHFHEFRDYGSIVYDQRILGFRGMDQVSISTTNGRIDCFTSWLPSSFPKNLPSNRKTLWALTWASPTSLWIPRANTTPVITSGM